MAGKRRKPKKKAGLGYIIVLLLILIIFAAGGVFVSKRFAPSKTPANLEAYYNLTEYSSADRSPAAANELAIVINDRILDNDDSAAFRAVSDNGIYIGLSLVQDYIDERFYLDSYENKIIFTNANESIITEIDSTSYSSAGTEYDAGYVIAKTINDMIYLNMDFVSEHSAAQYKVLSDPARVYIQNKWGAVKTCTVTADARMRTSANKKSSIVTTVEKGTVLKVLDQKEDWYKVIDENGFTGYVQNNFTGETEDGWLTPDYTEPEYTHKLIDGSVNMVWHGIYYYESNQYVDQYTNNMTGVNVLAPTWFLFADEWGNLTSYADQSYVDYAHSNGWQVWAVLEDLDGLAGSAVVPYTSSRQNAIAQMMEQCRTYGIDGINVDLENISSDQGADFIQFIRELSVECRKNSIILSVCDYAPYSYNAYRRTEEQSRIADYVCVMAYDDYVGGNEAGPNAGLPFIREVMGLCENNVDMSRLIVGLPFYTRVWYERNDGSLGADTVDMGAVEDLVWQYNLEFVWQEDTGYDYASYEDWNSTARIWRENAKSLDAKLQLISQYDVAGVAAWRLGQETSDVWSVISKYY